MPRRLIYLVLSARHIFYGTLGVEDRIVEGGCGRLVCEVGWGVATLKVDGRGGKKVVEEGKERNAAEYSGKGSRRGEVGGEGEIIAWCNNAVTFYDAMPSCRSVDFVVVMKRMASTSFRTAVCSAPGCDMIPLLAATSG